MASVLTLHKGDAEASFVEHPTETARKALMAAAQVENGLLADQLCRFAKTLPARRPIQTVRKEQDD